MTIFIPPTESSRRPRGGQRGYTLVELMIGAALSAMILAGVLSAFLMLNRSSLTLGAYTDMAAQVRRGLETFGEDARRASDIHWNSAQSITLTLVSAGAATTQVTYAYDPATAGATAQSFYRVAGDATSPAARQVLVSDVASDFSFQRYKLSQPNVADAVATSDLGTKRVAVALRAARLGSGAPQATQSVVSASYVLRNKRVSN